MASFCQHCEKKRGVGHMVSHAKNRLRRIFFPNLQKLKVLKNGVAVRVVLCTRCIKRLKKEGKIGIFSFLKPETRKKVAPNLAPAQIQKTKEEKPKSLESPVKKEKPKPTLKIEDIVGAQRKSIDVDRL